MRLAVAATPALAIPTLEWILDSQHSLDLVITRPDKPAGRGKEVQQSDVATWAQDHDVTVVKPSKSVELVELLEKIDLVVTLAYGVLLPESVLRVPRYGFVNVHFSLLPAWRGAAPVQRGIENGDQVSGLTVFQLDAGMDTGPIYVQERVDIQPEENSGQLLDRLAHLAPQSVSQTLKKIEAGELPAAQPQSGESLAPKISKDEARINWTSSAEEIARRIRAFTPDPGAWTQWRGVRMHLVQATALTDDIAHTPGSLHNHNGILIVGCGNNTALRVDQIQPAGKRMMQAGQWLNGARVQSGDSFD